MEYVLQLFPVNFTKLFHLISIIRDVVLKVTIILNGNRREVPGPVHSDDRGLRFPRPRLAIMVGLKVYEGSKYVGYQG